jgi:hypothetical protein
LPPRENQIKIYTPPDTAISIFMRAPQGEPDKNIYAARHGDKHLHAAKPDAGAAEGLDAAWPSREAGEVKRLLVVASRREHAAYYNHDASMRLHREPLHPLFQHLAASSELALLCVERLA